MKAAADVVRRMLKHNGVVNGKGRIYNESRDTYSLGYTEINTSATTPFGRTKTHKAWFVGDTDVKNGDVVIDQVDNYAYLVMSLKAEFTGGRTAYVDGTLYYANAVCSVLRTDGSAVDIFGRSSAAGMESIATGVRAMITAESIDQFEQKDQILSKNKIKIVMQATTGVQVNDRVSTDNGSTFKVNAIDTTALEKLLIVYAESDVR